MKTWQRANKIMSDSPGLVDFSIRLVIFVLNLPNRQITEDYFVINPANQEGFWG